MELNIDKRKLQISKQYGLNLSFWDFVFWQNNPIQINVKTLADNTFANIANMDLTTLYSYAKNPQYFEINSNNNPDIDRYFNGEIEGLRAHGEESTADFILTKQDQHKQVLAENFSTKQYEEYKHLVNFLASSNYPKSFQWLLLNETLNYTYRMDFSQSEPKLLVNARIPHQTILGMMNLPKPVIDYIYKNGPNYTSFKKLYTNAQIEYQHLISQESRISFDNVNTFGKGQWIKFNGKQTDAQNFETNVAKLKYMVATTPWCTATLASTHLEQGDFYVFVDNENNPHIAVKMNGSAIDEVRGIQNGRAQEIEPEYRDVAISFLKNNQEIENGKYWLKKEESYSNLTKYIKDIDDGVFDAKNVGKLSEALIFTQNDIFIDDNTIVDDIRARLPQIKPQIAKYYGYRPDEVHIGDVTQYEPITHNIKLIVGNVYREKTNSYIDNTKDDNYDPLVSLCNVEKVIGNLRVNYHKNACNITQFEHLKEVMGNFECKTDNTFTSLNSLGTLQTIGGSCFLGGFCGVKDLGNLQHIGRSIFFNFSNITNLGQLTTIEGIASFSYSMLTDLGNLKTIGHGDFIRSRITDLGNLEKADSIEVNNNSLINLRNAKISKICLKKCSANTELQEILTQQEYEEYYNNIMSEKAATISPTKTQEQEKA